ncbi:MAG: SGNH/GDSL hydrolase family protein [Planctomycetota bacterium]
MREPRPETIDLPPGTDTRPVAPRGRLLRFAGALLLLQAGCALEIDPYHAQRAGAEIELAGRLEIQLAAALLTLLALVLLVRPRPWPALAALANGSAALLLSTPHGAASFHVLQALLLAGATLALAVHASRGGRAARLGTRLLLPGVLLCLTEAAFATVARSHAVGYTLAARLWFARHWNPPSNSLGFRDEEQRADERRDLFLLGDSFVSGVGIADVSQRFGDRLAAELGNGWRVHNLGYNGADTRCEREILEQYPFQADVIVLSYYTNDIALAGDALGLQPPYYRPYRDLGRLAWLVSRSYTLDFLYWLRPRADLAGEGRYLEHCHAEPAVVARHEQDLAALVASAQKRAGTVLALVFPELGDLAGSAARLRPALDVFARAGLPVVDVRALVADLEPAQRMVNANDAHPSAAVHARVAEALAAELRKLGPR